MTVHNEACCSRLRLYLERSHDATGIATTDAYFRMTERRLAREPYWNDERALGRLRLGGQERLLHARSHVADEPSNPASTSEERLLGLAVGA